ncbi:hypothetical protein FAZ21_11340 [Chitiniphilus eburneus]|nr:hypothetical protein FAZ21_11340 [Chitiniphilus eburneus]
MGSAIHRQLRLQLFMDAPAQAAGEAMRRIPLFDSQPGPTDAATWTQHHSLPFAGHELPLTISSQPEHWQRQRWLSSAVLLAGIALSVLVFLLVRQKLERRLAEHRLELAHYSRVITLGEMSSAIAHELRQPLAAILAYLDGCQRKLHHQRLEAGELQTILEKSATQAERAQSIIARVQAAVKREKDSAQPRQQIRLHTLLGHVLALAHGEAQQAGVTLEVQAVPDHALLVAAMDVELILLNLIRNAIQATQGQPGAWVGLICHPEQDRLQIEVRDNGPGISDTIMATLFEAHRTSKEDGTGMGLRLSRFLAEANAATLTAGRNTPRGSVFILTLPTTLVDRTSQLA